MNEQRYARIEIAKEYLGFSAAHFTIFDAERRENLHGHSFRVGCEIVAPVGDDGLCFDYGVLKRLLRDWCDAIDERLLLPGTSPHLRIDREDAGICVRFANETLRFLPRDVLVLPIANVTVEALAHWLLAFLRAEPRIVGAGAREIVARVSSGAGQWASACWSEA